MLPIERKEDAPHPANEIEAHIARDYTTLYCLIA